MDPLDFAIYRALSPGGEARFWAGRRLIDPRIPVREIAEQVGVSENGVRLRLKGLTRRGFLRGRMVVPNPSLFGVRLFVVELPVKEAGEVERIYRDLALVEGVVFARDTIDEGERRVQVQFVAEDDARAVRRTVLLARLTVAGRLGPPRPYWIPPCDVPLTPLDWRVLRAVSQHPDASIAETARTVGISLKTGARRYHHLLDARACWWTHGPDAEEFPLAFLRLDVRSAKDAESVMGKVLDDDLPWMPVARDGFGVEPNPTEHFVAGLVPADQPTVLERKIRAWATWPGVLHVHRTFALGSQSFPTWLAEHLEQRSP